MNPAARGLSVAGLTTARRSRMPDPPQEQIQITRLTEPDGARRLVVAGELDMAVADHLGAAVREHRTSGQVLTVDLSQVTFMDSTGMRLLIMLDAESRTNGWRLSLLAGPAVWRVVELCGLQEMLPVRLA